MFGTFVRIPYVALPFRMGWKAVQQVSAFWRKCVRDTISRRLKFYEICIFNNFLIHHSYFLHSDRLDYCGIAVLIMLSFVPWLYYGFYCHLYSKLVYTSVVLILGLASIIVSLWDRFSEPALRPLRASKWNPRCRLSNSQNQCFVFGISNYSLLIVFRRCVHHFRAEWSYTSNALCIRWRLVQSNRVGEFRMANLDGKPLYHRGHNLRASHSWKIFSRQMRHLGKYLPLDH